MTKLNAVENVYVTDWQAYTPTGSITTNATYTGRWKRVGDAIQAQVRILFSGANTQGAMTFTDTQLLNGLNLTVDTTKIPGNNLASLGTWSAIDESVNSSFGGIVVRRNSSGEWQLNYSTGTSTASRLDTGTSTPFTISNGDEVSISFQVPIVGWSSNLVTGERAVEEYAADDGTNDVFGPNGALVPNVGLATGITNRQFAFSLSQQSTDNLIVEYNLGGTGWTASPVYPFITGQGGYSFGYRGYWQSSTLYRVDFGNGGLNPDNGLNAAGTTSWSAANAAAHRFRVRKVSGGAVVGYPVGARNVVGDTTGTAVPSGFIGEQIRSFVSFVNFPATTIWGDATSITLTPGVWDISAILDASNNVSTGTQFQMGISSTPGNTSTGLVAGDNRADAPYPTMNNDQVVSIPQFRVLVTSSTPYYLKIRGVYSSGTPQYQGRISAVRIA